MKIENTSSQRRNRKYLENYRLFENIERKIVRIINMLQDGIVHIEEEKHKTI